MKRYQGSWHVEQKPLFTDCFFIECRNKRGTENHTEQTALLRLSGRSCHVRHNTLTSGTGRIPESTDAAGYKDNLNVNRLHQRRHNSCDTGTPSGREKFIRRIDRHKRLAWLVLPAGDGQQELRTGLEIISKG